MNCDDNITNVRVAMVTEIWRFRCYARVCTAILFSLCFYNPLYYAQLRFFLCLNIDDKPFSDKHIFWAGEKYVVCLLK